MLFVLRKMKVKKIGLSSSIDFAKDQVAGADDGDDVGQIVATTEEIEGGDVGKAWGTDLATIRAF